MVDRPSDDCIGKWLLEVLRHTNHIEYYDSILQFKTEDFERPHDIVGQHNKLEWDIIKGCAWSYSEEGLEKDTPLYEEIHKAVMLHRHQYHHSICLTDLATPDNLRFEALDTICAMLEHRRYYAHVHNFEELEAKLEDYINCNGRHEQRLSYIKEVLPLMRPVERPDIKMIMSPEDFPNIGINHETYDRIYQRFAETLDMLRSEQGYSG